MATNAHDANSLLPSLIHAPDRFEKAAEVATFVSEALTAVGGVVFPPAAVVTWAIGYLTGGYADGRKFGRIIEGVQVINERVTQLEDASTAFVKSVDFIDLTEEVFGRIGRERSQEKRRLFAAFLADKLAVPDTTYDQDLRLLRIMDELAYEHLNIIKVLRNVDWLSFADQTEPAMNALVSAREDLLRHPLNEVMHNWYLLAEVTIQDIVHPDDIFSELGRRLLRLLEDT